MKVKKSVCVIGAGSSGLVTLKELLQEELQVECFEASDSLGGVFAGPGRSCSKIYDKLILTISNYYMAFSDFKPTDGLRCWSGLDYLEYLRKYAKAFDLERYIRYNCRVIEVRQSGKSWVVKVSENGGDVTTKTYDAVAVCSGTHQAEKVPLLKGRELFQGTIEHSSSFYEPSAFAGKKVVIVGLGESGADIVREISSVAAECHLVMRSYPFCVPRINRFGAPADVGTARLRYPQKEDALWVWLLCLLYVIVWMALEWVGLVSWPTAYNDLSTDAMGQEPKGKFMDKDTERTKEGIGLINEWREKGQVSYLNKFATKNISWLPCVLSKKCRVVVGAIKECYTEGVIMEDGSRLEADKVIFCTGYSDTFPFISDASLLPPGNDVRALFKHAFNPQIGGTLCYVGFSRPTTGAIPACSELVARYFALLVSEKRSLPHDAASIAAREKVVEDDMFYNSISVRTVVNPTDYMDGVARLIGCHVKPLSLCYNPRKLVMWLTAHSLPCRYRLVGPHAAPLAAEEWLNRALCGYTSSETARFILAKLLKMVGVELKGKVVF